MSQRPGQTGLTWVETGALIGALVGLGDGLRSVAYTDGTLGQAFVATLLAMLVPTWLGGLGLPLFVALFVPAAERGSSLAGSLRGALPVLGWLSVACVPAAAGSLAVLGLVMSGSRLGNHNLQALATLSVVVLLAALTRRSLESLSSMMRQPRVFLSLGLLILLACLALAPGSRHDPLRDLDSGNSKATRSAGWQERPPNILLVMLDTTRADRLSVYGHPEPTSPFLEELAQESTLYERAIAPAPWTLPSAASLFTGQLPHVHRADEEHRLLQDEFVTLAEILGEHGYRTAGFSSNSVVGETYNLHQGFQQYYEVAKRPGLKRSSPIQRLSMLRVTRRGRARAVEKRIDKGAADCNALVRLWLDEWQQSRKTPFFLFVNFLEAHLPYRPPQPHRSNFHWGRVGSTILPLVSDSFSNGDIYRLIGYRELMKPEDYKQLGDLYDASLAYQDAQLRQLVGELERRGVLSDTVLVVVGDHGENLGDHGGLLGHAFSVHQTLLRVPLLVRFPPAFEAGLRHEGLVAATGVFSTLLELAGASADAEWPPAVEPLPREAGQEHEVVVSEYATPVFELYQLATEARGVDIGPWLVRKQAIQNREWKLVRPSAGETVLFHLARDPHETSGLDPAAYPAGEALSLRLDEILAESPRPELAAAGAQEPLDDATRDALRALGYLR